MTKQIVDEKKGYDMNDILECLVVKEALLDQQYQACPFYNLLCTETSNALKSGDTEVLKFANMIE